MMKKVKQGIGFLLIILLLTATAIGETPDPAQVKELMDLAYIEAMAAAADDTVRQAEVTSEQQTILYEEDGGLSQTEVEVCSITDGTYTMRYILQQFGEPDENGLYPLFICLHGGGSDEEEGYVNNEEWLTMCMYYVDSIENGLYVAVRGITNNWDLHFDAAAYALYDRLIEDMIVFFGADPDRVYLLGFSAGGDGVYQITPRMADRFAAVNESSGHPNDVRLYNASNLPICIQAGIRDTMFTTIRSVLAADFDRILTEYQETFGFGYEHKVYIHVPEGHNFEDDDPKKGSTQMILCDPAEYVAAMADPSVRDLFPQEIAYEMSDEVNEYTLEVVEELGLETEEQDTNAVRFVTQYKRNAHPVQLVWDLTMRAAGRDTQSFYWLKAEDEVNEGLIQASFDAEENRFSLDILEAVNGDICILIQPEMVDMTRPVLICLGDQTAEVEVVIDEETIYASMADTLDRELAYVMEISLAELGLPRTE